MHRWRRRAIAGEAVVRIADVAATIAWGQGRSRIRAVPSIRDGRRWRAPRRRCTVCARGGRLPPRCRRRCRRCAIRRHPVAAAHAVAAVPRRRRGAC
eukprot:17002-Chlamydomonas_euryale.AAC.8